MTGQSKTGQSNAGKNKTTKPELKVETVSNSSTYHPTANSGSSNKLEMIDANMAQAVFSPARGPRATSGPMSAMSAMPGFTPTDPLSPVMKKKTPPSTGGKSGSASAGKKQS